MSALGCTDLDPARDTVLTAGFGFGSSFLTGAGSLATRLRVLLRSGSGAGNLFRLGSSLLTGDATGAFTKFDFLIGDGDA